MSDSFWKTLLVIAGLCLIFVWGMATQQVVDKKKFWYCPQVTTQHGEPLDNGVYWGSDSNDTDNGVPGALYLKGKKVYLQ